MKQQIRPRPYEPPMAADRYIGLAHSAPRDLVIGTLIVAILIVLASAAGLRP